VRPAGGPAASVSAGVADLRLPGWEPSWPQRRERRPRFVDAYYLHYTALVESLVHARDRYVRRPARILDVGCGDMPYYPLFAEVASEYLGSDVEPGPRVTYVCPVEALDVPDASFDLVLCTQVLEHVSAPERALAEIARVLRPGGHAFVSTHGVWPFHPYPADRWRWTQQGLEKLVEETPGVALRELVPHRATAASLALLLNYYVDLVTRRTLLKPLGWAAISVLNAAALAGDRIERLRYPHQDTLIHNYLAICERVPAST
jgi:SAM-dependent methyltransferase